MSRRRRQARQEAAGRAQPAAPAPPAPAGPFRRWRKLLLAAALAAGAGLGAVAVRQARLQNPAEPVHAVAAPVPANPREAVDALQREAVQVAGRLVRDFPSQPDAFVVQGSVQSGLGNSAAAMTAWERCLELDPTRTDLYYGMGWYAVEKGEYEKASALMRKAVERTPRVQGFRHLLAIADSFLGRQTNAVAWLEEELRLFPAAIESRSLLGEQYMQLKQYELAKKNFEAVLRAQPGHKKACYGLMTSCARLGLADEAKRYRERFAKMKAEELQTLIRESTSYDDLKTARQKAAAAHTDAGRIYANKGRHDQAEQHWLRAAALDPQDPNCRACLVQLYQAMNRPNDAGRVAHELRGLQREPQPRR